MELWQVALFWLVAGIIWGVACGVMDSRDICGVKAPGRPFRQILGGLCGYGASCLIFKHVDPEGGHTIFWLLEVVTISQLVQSYVRNWLR